MRVFEQLAANRAVVSGSVSEIERFLRDGLSRFPIFELLYMTDAEGRQRTENLWASPDFGGDCSAVGSDWSQRSWFRRAMAAPELQCVVSDIYLSLATDSYCFTLSKAIYGEGKRVRGVLAADVNFASLMNG